jgi:hypothetical protein
MAKNRKQQRGHQPIPKRDAVASPTQSAALPVPLGYDPKGPMDQRDIVRAKDGWSEYELDDGTVLRTKASLVDAKRAVGQFNAINGDPIYVLQFAVTSNTIAPASLKQKV